jgi:hypothetical protein
VEEQPAHIRHVVGSTPTGVTDAGMEVLEGSHKPYRPGALPGPATISEQLTRLGREASPKRQVRGSIPRSGATLEVVE